MVANIASMAMLAQYNGPDFRSLGDLEAALLTIDQRIVECRKQLENLRTSNDWFESTHWTPNHAMRALEFPSRPRASLKCPSATCASQTRAAESQDIPFPGWPKGTVQGDYKPRYENLKCDRCGSTIHTIEVFRQDIDEFVLRVLGVTLRVRGQVVASERLLPALRALEESRFELRRKIGTKLLTGESIDWSIEKRLMSIESPDVLEGDEEWIDRNLPSLLAGQGPEENRRTAEAFNAQREAATLRIKYCERFNETVTELLKNENAETLNLLIFEARSEMVRNLAKLELRRRQE